jgi:hypothetical protein
MEANVGLLNGKRGDKTGMEKEEVVKKKVEESSEMVMKMGDMKVDQLMRTEVNWPLIHRMVGLVKIL